jgi:outer membrane murein-binding lipoprotein Lpp
VNLWEEWGGVNPFWGCARNQKREELAASVSKLLSWVSRLAFHSRELGITAFEV